jgi:hypothetical protein
MSLILSGTDGLSDVDGSAATPAIRGTDANTGIFFPAADTIAFATGGTEDARFNSAGNLQTIGTISVGNATPSTSGAGITFPATQSASSDVNTLDDYEEGTWTPTDGSGAGLAIGVNTAYYTKIGRMVTIQAYVSYPATANTSTSYISGLPFPIISNAGYYAPFIVNTNAGISTIARVQFATSNILLLNPATNVDMINSQLSEKIVIFVASYFTA